MRADKEHFGSSRASAGLDCSNERANMRCSEPLRVAELGSLGVKRVTLVS